MVRKENTKLLNVGNSSSLADYPKQSPENFKLKN